MFTKEAQELAKPTIEAIKKISKKGVNPLTGAALTVPEWEWEPEWGERVIQPLFNTLWIYKGIARAINGIRAGKFESEIGNETTTTLATFIPLLHWERIEEMLEGMGYYLSVIGFEKEDSDQWETEDYQAYICVKNRKDKQYKEWYEHGKNRQISVMKAIIKMGKENGK